MKVVQVTDQTLTIDVAPSEVPILMTFLDGYEAWRANFKPDVPRKGRQSRGGGIPSGSGGIIMDDVGNGTAEERCLAYMNRAMMYVDSRWGTNAKAVGVDTELGKRWAETYYIIMGVAPDRLTKHIRVREEARQAWRNSSTFERKKMVRLILRFAHNGGNNGGKKVSG
jgi:hypothetical protein